MKYTNTFNSLPTYGQIASGLFKKPVVIKPVCPNCGFKGHRTTLTNNSYACKKCKTWWAY